MKKRFSVLLAAILSLSALSCKSNAATNKTSVELWSCYSTLKVLQDKPDAYDDEKGPAAIDLEIARGEKEAAQLIMTAKGGEVKYDVSVSDLVKGDDVIPSSSVTVYHEKYLWVVGSEYYSEEGYYPDCLVPFDNVKSVGENVIAADCNQGLYVRFGVPTEQAAGTYKGTITIKAGDREFVVPITLKVVSAYITPETHSLSIFNNAWYMSRGELDTTNDMLDKYTAVLTEYRCGTQTLMTSSYETDAEIQLYAERACEYVKSKESVCFGIPKFIGEYENYDLDGEIIGGSYIYRPEPTYKYYKTLAYEGLKQGVNVFSKAVQIGYDEPNGTAEWKIQLSSHIIRKMKDKVIAELKADDDITDTRLRDEICESLDKMPHVVTASTMFTNIEWNLGVEEDFVYCPYFSWASSPSARDFYRITEDNQLWWYGCCSPDYPYPTYHTDDTLISARVVSWMQYEYGVIGNLYWATDYYSSGNSSEVDKTAYLEDYYGEAVRSTRTNGEGYLFYPGKKYGVDGPLPSLRLESIRDGLEEYELMYYLDKAYAEINERTGKNFDAKKIIGTLGEQMYTGTKIYTSDAVFASARKSLLSTCSLASGAAGILIADVREGADYIDYDVYCNDGFVPSYNAGSVINTENLNGGKLYTVRVSVGTATYFTVSATVDGEVYSISNKLPSVATVYNADYLSGKITQFSKNTPCEISVDGSIIEGDKAVKLNFTSPSQNLASIHSVKFEDKSVLGKIGADTDKLLFSIYNASSSDLTFIIGVEYGDETGIYNENEFILKPGMNVVGLKNLSGIKWAKRKRIESLRLMFGGDPYAKKSNLVYNGRFVCEANANVYIVDASVYKV